MNIGTTIRHTLLIILGTHLAIGEVTVTPLAPTDGSEKLAGGDIQLQAQVNDPENQPLTVTFYGRIKAPERGEDFTLVTIPDTQNYTDVRDFTDDLSYFVSQTNWIVEAKDDLNIAFVSHLGDIAQSYNLEEQEYIDADTAMSLIEDPVTTALVDGIPWGIAPGNHDIARNGWDTSLFNQHFGISRFSGRQYYQGSYGLTNDNNYQFFSASGLDFIVLNLRYNAGFADPAILEWADAVLKAHPDRRAIVTSHNLLQESANWRQAFWHGHGLQVYQALRDNPNLFMMLCGHRQEEGMRTETFKGNTVYIILSDYQGRNGHGDSWLRYYVFSPMNDTITAKTYQTTTGLFETDADSEFALEYNLSGAMPWVEIETVSLPAGGELATALWAGVSPLTDYEWYAAVSNGAQGASTPIQTFTTGPNDPPTISLVSPLAGDTFMLTSPVEFAVSSNDPDGHIAKVEFYAGNVYLGEDVTEPYQFSWIPPLSGTYSIAARAFDNQGAASAPVEGPVTITNPENIAPSLLLNSPIDNEAYPTGNIELDVNASDEDGLVTKVEFHLNETKIGEVNEAPFRLDWVFEDEGIYTLKCLATDNDGGQTTREVTIYVRDREAVNLQQGMDGYSSTIDTMLCINGPSSPHADNSFLVVSGRSPIHAHSLVQFKNLLGNDIPQASLPYIVIAEATLDLAVHSGNDDKDATVLTSLLEPWDSTATWENTFGGNGIQLGHPETTSLALAPKTTLGDYASFDAREFVQSWVNGIPNYGFAILPSSTPSNTQVLFRSSDHLVPAERPLLSIKYIEAEEGEVFIFATKSLCSEDEPELDLDFTVIRAGSTENPLIVQLKAEGTATAGLDYQELPQFVTIPAGERTISFSLNPFKDDVIEGTETVIIKIAESPDYQVGLWKPEIAEIEDRAWQDYLFHAISDSSKREINDDADGDRIPNLVEYYLGSDPDSAGDLGHLFSPILERELFPDRPEADRVVYVDLPKRIRASGVAGTIEWSTNMLTWHRSGESDGELSISFNDGSLLRNEGDIEVWRYVGMSNTASLPKNLYLRVVVSVEEEPN